MNKRKTIVFGGAFNPPTIAHEAILRVCIDEAKRLDADIWVLPSGNRSDKKIPTTRETRTKYIEAMINDVTLNINNIKIINLELDRDKSSNTYDTVKELIKLYPDRLFIWVFGADSIDTMSSWEHGEWLFKNLDMLIINRSLCGLKKIPPKAFILDVKIPDISSTELRRRLSVGEPVADIVGTAVGRLLKNK